MPKKVRKAKKKSSSRKIHIIFIGIISIMLGVLYLSFFIHTNNKPPIKAETDPINVATLRSLVTSLVLIEYKQNPKMAMDKLKGMLGDNKIANQCHGITHILGNNAYIKYKDVSKAFVYYDEMCGSGYIHGVIEQKFSEIKNDKQVYQILPTICAPENSGMCFHGVGHGFMWYSSDNLPKALNDCDALHVSYRVNNCYDGVFMENFEGDHDVHPTQYINAQNPSYPCNQIDQKYKESCYFYSVRYYAQLYPNKYLNAFNWCRTQELSYQLTCIKGVGSAMLKENVNDPNLIANYCNQTINENERVSCIDGLVSYYLTNYYSINKGAHMCQSLMSEDQQQCMAAVDKRRNLFPN